MPRDFDIFEKFPDGSKIWRTCVSGQFEADRKIQELAEHSNNEFVAIDIQAWDPSSVIVGPHRSQSAAKKAANG
jgi:hypothetical protein